MPKTIIEGYPPAGTPDGGEVVYGVYPPDKSWVKWYARSGDDVWTCVTGEVDEDHGFKRVYMPEAEFREMIKARLTRLRIGLDGKYRYDN